MDDRFRLIFRGEVLEGQHPAVVRKRITDALKLDDEKSAALFSGKVVVLKRDADEKTAIRYQALFQKAGARLRLLPVEGTDESSPQSRPSPVPTDVTGSGLTIAAEYVAPPARPAIEIAAPDFSLADRGVLLGDPQRTVTPNIPEAEFELAEPGADIGSKKNVEPALDIASIHFEVAEVGADLGELRKSVAAVNPDISHLKLIDA